MRCGECDAHNAAYIARGQPSLLIVVGAIQLPALILQSKKNQKKKQIENLFASGSLANRLSSRQLTGKCAHTARQRQEGRLEGRKSAAKMDYPVGNVPLCGAHSARNHLLLLNKISFNLCSTSSGIAI